MTTLTSTHMPAQAADPLRVTVLNLAAYEAMALERVIDGLRDYVRAAMTQGLGSDEICADLERQAEQHFIVLHVIPTTDCLGFPIFSILGSR